MTLSWGDQLKLIGRFHHHRRCKALRPAFLGFACQKSEARHARSHSRVDVAMGGPSVDCGTSSLICRLAEDCIPSAIIFAGLR